MTPMNPSIFKAYDIRGIYPSEISERDAARIAMAVFKKLKPHSLVLARDGRKSSPRLEAAVLRAAIAARIPSIHRVGLMTTPGFYFLVNVLKADFGVMVTASHNPKEHNGLKLVKKKAVPVSGKEIYALIAKEN